MSLVFGSMSYMNTQSFDLQTVDIYIRDHALERMLERYPEHLRGVHSKSDRVARMKKILRESRHLTDWKRVPFYVQSVSQRYTHGNRTEFFHSGSFIFVCVWNDRKGQLAVNTVVNNILYYPSSNNVISVGTPGGARYYKWEDFESRMWDDARKENARIDKERAKANKARITAERSAKSIKEAALAEAKREAKRREKLRVPHIHPSLPGEWEGLFQKYNRIGKKCHPETLKFRKPFMRDLFRVYPPTTVSSYLFMESLTLTALDNAVRRVDDLEKNIKGGVTVAESKIKSALDTYTRAILSYKQYVDQFFEEDEKSS